MIAPTSQLSRLIEGFGDSMGSGQVESVESIDGQEANLIMRNSPVNLLLKLMDKTYLSLPVIDCHGVKRIVAKNIDHDHQEADACRIDWTGAKLIGESTGWTQTMSERQTQARSAPSDLKLATSLPAKAREILLSNLENLNLSSFVGNFNISEDHSSRNDIMPIDHQNNYSNLQERHLNMTSTVNMLDSSNSNNLIDLKFPFLMDFNATKYIYLAASSSASTLGIFMNFFLLLILIFGARQTCNSISRSSNNTNRTNPLLMQLTLTGLLLACYILTDDVRLLSQQQDTGQAQRIDNDSMMDQDRGRQVSLCHILAESPSTLSTFLPPTPFDMSARPLYSVNAIQPASGCNEMPYKQTKGPRKRHTQGLNLDQLVVILTYSDDGETMTPADKSGDYPKQVGKIMIESNGAKPRNIFDLTRKMASIRLTLSSCKRSDELERLDLNLDYNLGRANIANPSEAISGTFKVGDLMPLIMNLIASIHIWTVAALAYDRYCAIANPLQYLRSIYTARIRLFFIILWSVSVTVHLILPLAVRSYNRNYNVDLQSSAHHHLNETLTKSSYANNLTTADDAANDLAWKALLSSAETQFQAIDQEQAKICHYRPLDGTEGSPSLPRINSREELLALEPNQLAVILTDWSSRSLLGEPDVKATDANTGKTRGTKFCVILLLASSVLGFVMIILAPLLLITICNVSIYSIVKVHERRLSTSSGSNMGISSTHINGGHGNGGSCGGGTGFAGHHTRQSLLRRDGGDDRSDCESISSILINQVMRIGLRKKKRDKATRLDSGELINGSSDSPAKDLANDFTSSVVNRSKRLVARQDSAQLIAKLGLQVDSISGEVRRSSPLHCGEDVTETLTPVVSPARPEVSPPNLDRRHQRLKRKSSDQRLTFALVRKDSDTSQTDNSCGQCGLDGCDIDSPHVVTNDRFDSTSIINQLKMAGLSFAGVAIHELSGGNSEIGHHRQFLQKSSSCSLGNIYSNHGCAMTHHSDSRSNFETQSVGHQAKRAYVTSLNTNGADKYSTSTRLLDAEGGHNQQQQCDSHLYHLQSTHRLPFSIGTKSAAFNVVIWIILTMLVLSMPQYLLVTISQVVWSNYDDKSFDSDLENELWNDFVAHLLSPAVQAPTVRPKANQDDATVLQMGSIWLSCICRILFITMVPLNGWLYGIRSRSLKVSIRMVLKRYISRRQASIEINQRQRSISSVKSRDSSYVNFQTCYNHNSNSHKTCYYHNHSHHCQSLQHQNQMSDGHSPVKLFRRCSSYNAIKRGDSNPSKLTHLESATFLRDQRLHYNPTYESGSASLCSNSARFKRRVTPNTIKFVLGEHQSIDQDSDCNSMTQMARDNLLCTSANSSQNGSLTSSYRSLPLSNAPPSTGSNAEPPKRPTSINFESGKTRQQRPWHLSNSFNAQVKAGESPNIPGLRCQSSGINVAEPASRRRSGSFTREDRDHFKILVNEMKNDDLVTTNSSDANQMEGQVLAQNDSMGDTASEFKFLITSIDHETDELTNIARDHSSLLGEDPCSANQTKSGSSSLEMDSMVYSENCRACHAELLMDEAQDSRQQPTGSLMGWCKSLKHQVTRMLVNASIGFITGNMTNSDSSRRQALDQQSKSSSEATDVTGCCTLDPRSDLEPQDQCRVALLRKSSLDSHCNGMWRVNPLGGLMRSSSSSSTSEALQKATKKLRNSLTMANVEQANALAHSCQCHGNQSTRPHSDNQSSSSINSTSLAGDQQQAGGYLKPPNFLKLILDSDVHPALYSSSSALSPIKECSSNHSYASSQSSLANNNLNQQNRHLSMSDLSARSAIFTKVESAAASSTGTSGPEQSDANLNHHQYV